MVSGGMSTDHPFRFHTDPSAYSILLMTTLPSFGLPLLRSTSASISITFTGLYSLTNSNFLLSFGFALNAQTYCRNSYSAAFADGWYSQTMLLITLAPTFLTWSCSKY